MDTVRVVRWYRVSAWTGWPGVSVLWLGEIASFICSFYYFSVAARKRVWAELPLRCTSMSLGRSASNQQLLLLVLLGRDVCQPTNNCWCYWDVCQPTNNCYCWCYWDVCQPPATVTVGVIGTFVNHQQLLLLVLLERLSTTNNCYCWCFGDVCQPPTTVRTLGR